MQCPLLCKEFVVDAWQIYYARSKGADAILLIAAVLPDLDIKYMTKICKMVGLTPLVEVGVHIIMQCTIIFKNFMSFHLCIAELNPVLRRSDIACNSCTMFKEAIHVFYLLHYL